MPQKLICYLLLILLSGCASIESFDAYIDSLFEPPPQDTTKFTQQPNNRFFNYRQLSRRNVVLLPVRGSMGGGGGDERVAPILIPIIKERLPEIYLITDDQADRYFTDNDIWDDYFSYISFYSAKGLVDIDTLVELYSQLSVATIFAITSDLFFTGVEGMYPRNFHTFISIQVFDVGTRQVVWDGMVEAQEVIESKEESDKIVKKSYQKIAQRLMTELTR